MNAPLRAALEVIKKSAEARVFEISPVSGNLREVLSNLESMVGKSKVASLVIVAAKR